MKSKNGFHRFVSSGHSMLIAGLLIAGLAVGVVACTSPSSTREPDRGALDLERYAQACDAELSEKNKIDWPKTLQCEAGPILPIERAGVVLAAVNEADRANFKDSTQCDKPPLLDISSGGIGQCVPNSRLQVNRVPQEGVAEGDRPYQALLCRNYRYRSTDAQKVDPQYDDVAMIVYNPKNKKTCFFQRISDTRLQGLPAEAASFKAIQSIPGNDVPSPFDASGRGFWDYKLAKEINCARCHDANPFVRSPYVYQVTQNKAHSLPIRSFGQPYGIVKIDDFGDEWKKLNAYFAIADRKKTAKGACVMCHSLGPGESSGRFTDFSAGKLAPNQFDSPDFQLTHWMPPGADKNQWNADYAASVDFLLKCSKAPSDPGCGRTWLY